MVNSMTSEKWFWIMDYCKRKHISPAREWAWREAEEEYDKIVRKKTNKNNNMKSVW
jgi:hypothetical protein